MALIVALSAALLPAGAVFADDADTGESSAPQHSYLPRVGLQPAPCFTKSNPTLFGVQMYGNTGNTGEFFTQFVDTGADWVRVAVYWSDVEPVNTSPANYDWEKADAAVSGALDACKRVILMHRGAPGWAAAHPESVLNPANEADFVQYIGALAERYDGDGRNDAPGSPVVHFFEIYNEPDGSANTKGQEHWGEYPADYARVLAKAYDAIKAASPNAKVLFGGVAFDRFTEDGGDFVRSFVNDVLAIDKGKHFDYFNYHAYPAYSATWIEAMNPGCVATDSCEGPGLLEKHQYLMNILKQHNAGNKPVIVTESGWWSNPAEIPSTEEVQARYVTELYTQSKAAGLSAMIYFALVDPDDSQFDYGLFTNPVTIGQTPRTKKSFNAYVVAKQWLGGATYVNRLSQSEIGTPEMDAYKFRSADGSTFYVAWLNPVELGVDLDGNGTPDTPAEFESLRLPFNHAEVYDIYGSRTAIVQDTDGDIRVTVGAQPVYIKIVD